MSVAPLSSLITSTRIDLLRHGEVEGGNCFRGSHDDPLTAEGWHQMHTRCLNRNWDVIVTSPLSRCQDFAKAWAIEHHIPLKVDTDWSEIHFGEWEGLTAEQIEQAYPEALKRFYQDPCSFTPPGAEHYEVFAARIQRGWEHLMTQFTGKKVLLVTHAGPIRALFSLLLAIPVDQSLHIEVCHACLTRFSCYDEGDNRFIQLNFHNPD
jgi:alpha-ribazole phosphatase/probable phosphoglycerate mutase